MGLFDFLKQKNNGQFVSEAAFKRNFEKQKKMTPQTMGQLRKLSITEDQELKLEYFFYTNAAKKAEDLSQELSELKYSVEHGVSAHDKKLFVITGWTPKLKMETIVVEQWTGQMCEIGNKFDCEFDGWGTTPDQEV